MATAQVNRARMQFLTWVRDEFPDLFNAAVRRADVSEQAQMLAGLGAEDQVPWYQKIAGVLTTAGTAYLALKAQRDAMKLNLIRAEQGLPPIDAAAVAPVIRTQIDLPPDVVEKVTGAAGVQVNKMLLFGAAAVVAIMLFMRR